MNVKERLPVFTTVGLVSHRRRRDDPPCSQSSPTHTVCCVIAVSLVAALPVILLLTLPMTCFLLETQRHLGDFRLPHLKSLSLAT